MRGYYWPAHDGGPPIDVNTEDNQENQTMQPDATEEADATEAGESETPVSVSSATTMLSATKHLFCRSVTAGAM